MGVPTAPTVTGDTSVDATEVDTFFTECADIINVENSKGLEATNLSASAGFKNSQKAEPYSILTLPFNLRPISAVVQTGSDANNWRRGTLARIYRVPWPAIAIGLGGFIEDTTARVSALLYKNADVAAFKNRSAYLAESGQATGVSIDLLAQQGEQTVPCRVQFSPMDDLCIVLRHDASIAASARVGVFVHLLVPHQRSG